VRELFDQEGVTVSETDPSKPDWIETARRDLDDSCCVLANLATSSGNEFASLERLLVGLGTRKLVVLRSQGGLGAKEVGRVTLTPNHRLVTSDAGISVINLRSDLSHLRSGAALGDDELQLLLQIASLHSACPGLLTSVASPLNLLRELFTVKGAGTLIKTGSNIEHYDSYAQIDRQRLVHLLEDTFERPLVSDFLNRKPEDVYLEAEYRGAAIVVSGAGAAFLTKFAVNKRAQGEGIGRDLWESMVRDHDRIYWRARPKNPAVSWYQSECDGMQRTDDWLVFWKGVAPESVPALIADAIARKPDFALPQTPGSND
jgi:GNAT superfamily N-acetyltransferase